MVKFNVSSYCMMILHATKYPDNSVDGILLGKINNKEMIICEAVPLFHIDTNLIPMYEIGLRQIEKDYQERGLVIVGYYTANESADEINLEKSMHRVSNKIAENAQTAFHVIINNSTLRINLDNIAIKVAQCIDGKWKMLNTYDILFSHASTLDICSALLRKQVYKDIVDFDLKLDNVFEDWSNFVVKKEIADFVQIF